MKVKGILLMIPALLIACNGEEEQQETTESPETEAAAENANEEEADNYLEYKMLEGEKDRYLNMGTDHAAVYDVNFSEADFESKQLVVEAYEDGERVDEFEDHLLAMEEQQFEQDEFEELLLAFSEKTPGNEEINTHYSVDIGSYYAEEDSDDDSFTGSSTFVEIPFQMDTGIASFTPQLPVEADEPAWIYVFHSGSSMTSDVYEEEEIERIIEGEDHVILIGVNWSTESISE